MIRDAFERILFVSRFLLAPLYLALAISLVAILFKAGLHLYELLSQLPNLADEDVLLSELAIVDLTLTASLVVIVFLSGYTNFVAPVLMRKDDGRPHWIGDRLHRAQAQTDGVHRRHLGDQAARGFHECRERTRSRTLLVGGASPDLCRFDAVLAISDRVSPHTHPSNSFAEDS